MTNGIFFGSITVLLGTITSLLSFVLLPFCNPVGMVMRCHYTSVVDGFIGIAGFSCLDKIGVLGKPCRVQVDSNSVLVAELASRLDILHGDWLSADGIIGNSKDDKRYVSFVFAQYFLQFFERDVSFERCF